MKIPIHIAIAVIIGFLSLTAYAQDDDSMQGTFSYLTNGLPTEDKTVTYSYDNPSDHHQPELFRECGDEAKRAYELDYELRTKFWYALFPVGKEDCTLVNSFFTEAYKLRTSAADLASKTKLGSCSYPKAYQIQVEQKSCDSENDQTKILTIKIQVENDNINIFMDEKPKSDKNKAGNDVSTYLAETSWILDELKKTFAVQEFSK